LLLVSCDKDIKFLFFSLRWLKMVFVCAFRVGVYDFMVGLLKKMVALLEFMVALLL